MLPSSRPEEFSTPANCAACRRAIKQGSQSFYLASMMLPVTIRESAYAVYAFCRMADDRIDREQGGDDAISAMRALLDRVYQRRPADDFVERGFADVVFRHAIPRAIPEALLEGLAWDAGGRRYRTLEELHGYALRVAGTVGVMMTLVMGRRDPSVLARAIDLGVAMQLTNIVRDIGEDARNGRLYLPLDWMTAAGLDPEEWRRAPGCGPEIRAVAERLLAEAEILYDRAASGIAELPGGCRLGINAARLLYREIGREVQHGVDPVATRAVTTRQQKLRLMAEALASRISDGDALDEPALAGAAFLLQAVATAEPARTSPRLPPWWAVIARSERMMELLSHFDSRRMRAPRAAINAAQAEASVAP